MAKSWATFAFAVLAALALAFFTGNFLALYGLVFLFLYCLLTVATASRMIGIEMQLDKDCVFKGDGVACAVTITNRGWMFYPEALCVRYNGDVLQYKGLAETIALGPRKRKKYRVEIGCPYRGIYRCGVDRLIIRDHLGLFRIDITPRKAREIAVFPLLNDSFGFSIRREGHAVDFRYDQYYEDYSTVADVRSYTPSDSLRKVHWKLSAKRGELVVKNFQQFEPNPTVLFLDTVALPLEGAVRAEFEDVMVSYGASAIQYCARGRLSAVFRFGNGRKDVLPVDPGEDLEKVLHTLAGITFQGEGSNLPGFCRAFGEEEEMNLVAFLSGVGREGFDAVREFISLGHAVLLYRFYSTENPLEQDERAILDTLETFGASVVHILVE